MLQKLIRLLVIGVVLYVVYFIAGIVVAALALPALVLTLAMVILLLVFVYELLLIFGITF